MKTEDGAVEDLFWRSEILEALYWMRGEGLAAEVQPAKLAEFLVAELPLICRQLELLAADGYVELASGGCSLTELGLSEGARTFQDDFGELIHAGHMECSPGCWCKDPDHAGEPCPSQPEEPQPEPARRR